LRYYVLQLLNKNFKRKSKLALILKSYPQNFLCYNLANI
jgi:hypothetical protein